MSPVTGPVATAIAFSLATALGFAGHSWQVRQARYEARIAELTDAADRTQSALKTELAACHAAAAAPRLIEADPPAAARAKTADRARSLLAQQPEGIDACARMESADRAVLSNLSR